MATIRVHALRLPPALSRTLRRCTRFGDAEADRSSDCRDRSGGPRTSFGREGTRMDASYGWLTKRNWWLDRGTMAPRSGLSSLPICASAGIGADC